MGSVRAAGVVLPVLAFVALTQVQGAWAAAGGPQASVQWQTASPDAGKSLDIALRSVRAGIAERERALGLAAQLEQLDFEELAIWEQLIPSLPGAALTPEARTQESAMRLGALPLLSARQKEYRALELELGRALAGASAASPDPAAVGKQMVRLASIREWSDLVDQAQRQTRTTLDMTHAFALARAAKAGMRMDAAALSALGQVRERRGRVEAARAEAAAAWETGRDAARIEQLQQALGIAAALAQAAMDNERRGDELRKRAAEASLPATLHDLLRGTADVLQSTARVGGRSAADMVGIVDWQAESFLAEPRKVDAADTALAALLVERRALAKALRASLAARVATLSELKALAEQRERVLAGAGYLPPSEEQRRAHAAVKSAAADAWQQIAELRVAAGDIAGAEAGERARAAELLAVRLEELVLLESQLNTLAIGQLLDLMPRPADPRLAGSASAWKRDVDALQAIDGRWTAWRKAWDERGKREEEHFAELRALVARIHGLWASRLSNLANALPQAAANDEISRLTIGIVRSADAHTQALAVADRDLRRLRDEAEADPVVGAVFKAADGFRWSQASAGLRDLPRLFDQVARLRTGGQALQLALNAALPAAQRIAAVMSLSDVLDVPWQAVGSGQDVQITTEVSGETYLLKGLVQDTPQLRREREYFVGHPIQLAALSMSGLRLAQAAGATTQPNPLPDVFYSTTPAPGLVPLTPRTLTMVLYHTTRELWDNRYIYAGMPIAGAAGGTVLAPGAGTAGGFLAGGSAAWVAAIEDAISGGAKGAIKGLAADYRRVLPADYKGLNIDSALGWTERNIEAVVDGLKAYYALSNIAKRTFTKIDPDAERNVANIARRSFAQARQAMLEAESVVRETSAQLRGLSIADRLAQTRVIREAQGRADAARKLVEALSTERTLAGLVAEWQKVAAETLSEVNDAIGPDGRYLSAPYVIARDGPTVFQQVMRNLVTQSMIALDRLEGGNLAPIDARTGSAAGDPEGEKAQQAYRGREQRRPGQTQGSAATAAGRSDRPSSDKLLESLASMQHELEMEAWEQKRERERQKLRHAQEEEKQKEKDKKDKDKKDKDPTTVQDGTKTPIKPVTPPFEPDPTKTDSAGSEKTGWWGFEAVISYKYKGASCTQTLSGEVFGTRAEAEQAMRDETARAMRADAGNRSEVVPVRQGFYAGLSNKKPTYTGPTGAKAVQCSSLPATTPSTPPAVPSVAKYEPKGSGQPCPQLRQQMMDRCSQMEKDAGHRNCAATGASGCSVGGPGCGGTFGDYVGWCTLHPSYEPLVTAGLTMFVSEIKACIELFLGDSKPGRQERGIECQVKAQKKLRDKRDTWVQQACQARCAQDGRSGTATLGGGRHMCECR